MRKFLLLLVVLVLMAPPAALCGEKAKVLGVDSPSVSLRDEALFGDDGFKLLGVTVSKDKGWRTITSAMEIPGAGCVLRVTTWRKTPDGEDSVSSTLTFVPGAKMVERLGKNGAVISRQLVRE